MSPRGSTTRRDILSAYVASFARIASWAAVSALVYRRLGATPFAILALVRSTLGILNYTSLGLAPALIHHLAKFGVNALPVLPAEPPPDGSPVLSYATPVARPEVGPPTAARGAYTTAVVASLFLFLLGASLLVVLGPTATSWLRAPSEYQAVTKDLVLTLGFGTLARILSDPAGAALQTFGRIALDNILLAAADVLWVVLLVVSLGNGSNVDQAGATFLWSSVFLLLTRYAFANRFLSIGIGRVPVDVVLGRSLFAFGLLVTIAQLADYMYAPTDFLLISHFLTPADLAAYAPAVQIDAALLVIVTGLASVVLPKAAIAHARNDTAALRRYYIQGTLVSTALLLAASLVTWVAGPLILRAWLHDIPAGTLRVLPIMLCHTVIGGSSAVGRSILLGSGRVRPFTVAVLLSGATNVAVSFVLVRYTSLGLTGIVLGTITAVTLRCALWMPWYTMRVLRGAVGVEVGV